MDIDNFGYVTVNKKELKLLCEECIEHIKKCREKKERIFILDFQKKYNAKFNRWYYKLIKKWYTPKILDTFELTKTYLDLSIKSVSIFESYEYDYHSGYAWGTKDAAKQLILCCESEISKEDILVNADIFYQLSVR